MVELWLGRCIGWFHPNQRKVGSHVTVTEEDKIERCARAAHNTLVAYCKLAGDYSLREWSDAPEWQRKDTIEMVRSTLRGVHSPAEEHGRWFKTKVDKGYVYGPEKNDDPDIGPLTNPSLLPYRDLPVYQRMKDVLLMTVVIGIACHYGLAVTRVPDLVYV